MMRRVGWVLFPLFLGLCWWLWKATPPREPPPAWERSLVTAAPTRPPGAPTPTPLPERPRYEPGTLVDYEAQPGDTLPALAAHFHTTVEAIRRANPHLPPGITTLPPGEPLRIPIYYMPTWGSPFKILPDPLFVYGPASRGFDLREFLAFTPGWLKSAEAPFQQSTYPAAYIVESIALYFSIDPRLLLALLDYQAGALSDPNPPRDLDFVLGFEEPRYRGFAIQVAHMADLLSYGYYGWRTGELTRFWLSDGTEVRPDPWLNAATVALQYYFAQTLPASAYHQAVSPQGFFRVYAAWFGDPWQRPPEPHIPGNLRQPPFVLPFPRGQTWNFTGGPHPVWGRLGVWAALDMAPQGVQGCQIAPEYAVAMAPGLVVRSERGILVLDLDGDGDERTGWVIFHLHVSNRPPVGALLDVRDPIGNPSCEGGRTTGSHVHFARKYNGEWIPAWGVLAFNMEGWIVEKGDEPYEGYLRQGTLRVLACPCANAATLVQSWREAGVSTGPGP